MNLPRIFARPLRAAALVGAVTFSLIVAGLGLELYFSRPYLTCLADAFEKHNDVNVEDVELAKRIAPLCTTEFSAWRAVDPLFRSDVDEVALALEVVWRHRGHRIA